LETSVASGIGPRTLEDRVFQNTLTLITGRGFGLVLSGVASILLARYLGSEQLGEYGALYAYLSLFGWLAAFGLESILAREAAKNRNQAGSILLTGVIVSTGFSFGASGVALILAPHFGYQGPFRFLLVFAAIDLLILSPLRLPGIVFQVDLRQWYGVGIGLIRQALWLAVLVLLAFIKASFVWVIIGRMICSVFEVALILFATVRRGFLSRPWRFLSNHAREYVSYGFPIAASALAVGIYHRIDQVMLHNMTNDKVLGGYVAAVNVTELFGVLPVALMGSLFPILSQVSAQEDRFQHYMKLGFRSMMAVVFGACALISPLAAPIIHLLYGAKFDAAGPLLRVLIWSEVPVFFGVVISSGLIAKNLQNYLPLSTGVGAIANVLLNLVMIPRWGVLGAAWATNVSYSLAAIFLFLIFRPTRSMALVGFRISIAPFLLALLITPLFFVIRLRIVFEVPIIAAAYMLGACLIGVVRRSEIDRVWQLIERNFALIRSNAN
jgi:O-antigen/teichoic acid export membrane protein